MIHSSSPLPASGVCFDVEMTRDDAPEALVDAFERAFVACKHAGLLVMLTTSHSAPYAAGSTETKLALVDAWYPVLRIKSLD